MERGTLAGGLCARIIHIGDDDGLEPAVLYLYGPWLNENGYALRDAPLFLERKTFYPAVPCINGKPIFIYRCRKIKISLAAD